MAVDLHTGDMSPPSQFLSDKHDDDILQQSREPNHSNINNNNDSALKPQMLISHEFGSHTSPPFHSTEVQEKDKDDDFIAELARQMAHFMLQDDDKFEFSNIGSENLELKSWDLIGSPQSTPRSSLGSNQGSPEGSYQEPSPPAAPGSSQDFCCKSTDDVVRMFEKMKLDERGNSKSHPGYGIQSSNTSNVRLCSHQALIQEQIRAIHQEQVRSLKHKLTAYRESQGQISQQSLYETEPKEQILQFHKKGKVGGVGSENGWRTHLPRPTPLHQQAGADMGELFRGGFGSRGASCGTGVFLPRGATSAPSESRKKPGNVTYIGSVRSVQAL